MPDDYLSLATASRVDVAGLSPDVELMRGNLRDPTAVRRALRGIDAVYHFAVSVGVGQSMYAIQSYTSANSVGTAALLGSLAAQPVEKLIVTSSMSVYAKACTATAPGIRAMFASAASSNCAGPQRCNRRGARLQYRSGRAYTIRELADRMAACSAKRTRRRK